MHFDDGRIAISQATVSDSQSGIFAFAQLLTRCQSLLRTVAVS